jgi:hypothetical protein
MSKSLQADADGHQTGTVPAGQDGHRVTPSRLQREMSRITSSCTIGRNFTPGDPASTRGIAAMACALHLSRAMTFGFHIRLVSFPCLFLQLQTAKTQPLGAQTSGPERTLCGSMREQSSGVQSWHPQTRIYARVHRDSLPAGACIGRNLSAGL